MTSATACRGRAARARRRRRPTGVPGRRGPRTGCSRARSGRRSRTSRGRRARASAGSRARSTREIDAEHLGLSRAQRQQARAQPQQRGLARAVRAREQHDLARLDVEIGACERGESSEHANGRPKVYDTQEGCSGTGERYARECTKAPARRRTGPTTAASGGSPPVPSAVVRRAIAAIGRMLVTLGLLILLFVAYELWGTGIFTARAQTNLKSQFQQELPRPTRTTRSSPVPTTATSRPHDADDHDHRRPHDAPRRRRRRRPRASRGHDHDPERSASNWRSSRARRATTSRRVRATTPARRCPGRSATPRSPATARRTAHPFFRRRRARARRPHHHPDRSPARSSTRCTSSSSWSRPTMASSPTRPTPSSRSRAATRATRPRQRIVIKAKLVVARARSRAVRRGRSRRQRREVAYRRPARRSPKASRAESNSAARSALGLHRRDRRRSLWWWAFRRWRHPLTWVIGVVPFLVVLFPFYVYLERALPAGTDAPPSSWRLIGLGSPKRRPASRRS